MLESSRIFNNMVDFMDDWFGTLAMPQEEQAAISIRAPAFQRLGVAIACALVFLKNVVVPVHAPSAAPAEGAEPALRPLGREAGACPDPWLP